MNYPLKPKQRRDPHLKATLIAVCTIVIIVLVVFVSGSPVFMNILGPVGTPIWKTRQWVSNFFGSNLALVKSKESLILENSNLKRQLDIASSVSLERDALLLDNNRLKSVAGGEGEVGEVASILSSPAQSIYDIVIAEVGPNSGVKIGDSVFGPNSIVLGSVVERSGNIIRIKYFSSSGTETPARIGKDGSPFVLKGQGGGNFIFVAPRDFNVNIGDVVMLPAITTSVLGEVNSVETVRSDSFKNVYVSFPINIFNLSYVRISHSH